jgi:type II secretory pathway pseudopilin PulG
MTMKYAPRGRGGNVQGFSNIEVVLTVALLTVLALSTILIFVPVSRQGRINREVAAANAEARRVIEKVHAVPYSQVTVLFPDDAEIALPSLPDGKLTVDYPDPAADPLVCQFVLEWDSPSLGTMRRAFTTAVTR